jgi:hypothetical protein
VLGSNALLKLFTLDSKVYGLPRKQDIDKVAAAVGRSANEITFEILSREAEKLARMVKDEIDSQPVFWPPLNDAYKKWKDKMGLNTDMNKATESYYDAIRVQEIRNDLGQFSGFRRAIEGSSFTIRVGLPYQRHPGIDGTLKDDGNEIYYTDLANILEYGTDKIPARPHWVPTYQRWRATHARTIRARITRMAVVAFQKHFRKAIIPASKGIKPPK